MIKFFTLPALALTLSLGLSACGEDEKADATAPAKQMEKAEPKKEMPEKKADADMTPAEALDNMKRDAGIVADKATDAYNAAKEAAQKALSE